MKHVVVTGGSRGLGLAIVKTLLSAGYCVSTCSRGSAPALDALRADPVSAERLFWANAQVGDAAQSATFLTAALAWAGDAPLYGLINNAGIAREGVLASFPDIETETVLQTNLTGAIQMARQFLRALLVQGGPGRIINISSIIGSRGYTGLAAYAASKAGLDGFTRALAREVGRRGITVNSVAPGYLETELSATLDPGQRDQIVRRTPAGRLGTSDDVVPLIRFLLSDQAAFISGQTLIVDGGLTC